MNGWRCTERRGWCSDVTGCDTAGRCLYPTAPDTQPAPASGEGEALREALAMELRGSRLFWGTHSDRWNDAEWQAGFWREVAEIALTSPTHARLVAERDEARETVRRVEAETIARVRQAMRDERSRDPSTYNVWSRVADVIERAALGGEQAGDGGGQG